VTLDEAIKVAEADLAEGGFFGASHLAQAEKDLATLRALKLAREAMQQYFDRTLSTPVVYTTTKDALAAISALYPEESPAPPRAGEKG